MNRKVVGYHISGKISISEVKSKAVYNVVSEEASEILFETESKGLIYVAGYGSIVFMDIDEQEQMKILKLFRDILKIDEGHMTKDELEIESGSEIKVIFNKVVLDEPDIDALRVIMLNLAQSVAMAYYFLQAEKLLNETKKFTSTLEEKGKLGLRGKKLLKYIGKVLNLKNGIAENLYIFDSPDMIWENQRLNIIDKGLKRELEIGVRHRGLVDSLNLVKENLELFHDVSQHAHSSVLEWIVIILILIEVVHMMIGWIF